MMWWKSYDLFIFLEKNYKEKKCFSTFLNGIFNKLVNQSIIIVDKCFF